MALASVYFDKHLRCNLSNQAKITCASLYEFSLLHRRFQSRHAMLLPTKVSGEEHCVTTLKTAVQQTSLS